MSSFTFKGLKLTGQGQKYVKELEKLRNMEIHVGFQSGDGSYDDGADVAEIAAYNEYGSSDTPARPFMKQSWESHESDLKQVCQQANNVIANGGTAEQACKIIGVAGVGFVQQEIVDGNFAPNAPSTIAKKGSAHPLIDTSRMLQSVKYVVKKGR